MRDLCLLTEGEILPRRKLSQCPAQSDIFFFVVRTYKIDGRLLKKVGWKDFPILFPRDLW